MPFISNGVYNLSEKDPYTYKMNMSSIYIPGFPSIATAQDIYQPSYSSYKSLCDYKQGNHYYHMWNEYGYSRKAILKLYDFDIETKTMTVRSHTIGSLSSSTYGTWTSVVGIVDDKVVINVGDNYTGFYDFESDIFTQISNEYSIGSCLRGSEFQVGYTFWTGVNTCEMVPDIREPVVTTLNFTPIALINDEATNRDAWIIGCTSSGGTTYKFVDDTSTKQTKITSFPDCKFEEAERNYSSASAYGIKYASGLNRWYNTDRNIIMGFVYYETPIAIYDIYGFNSTKKELKVRMMAMPDTSNVYKYDDDIVVASPAYSCYISSEPNMYCLACMNTVSDQPLEWYGMLFSGYSSPAPFLAKYTLED